VSQSNVPLVYVDDIRVSPVRVASASSRSPTVQSLITALDLVDPLDVARVEVLRGPAAAWDYGMDAANGVILIYTKHGPKAAADSRARCP
jgi:TonB-dependent SusC/RagA subfamily outer membrane receptor